MMYLIKTKLTKFELTRDLFDLHFKHIYILSTYCPLCLDHNCILYLPGQIIDLRSTLAITAVKNTSYLLPTSDNTLKHFRVLLRRVSII